MSATDSNSASSSISGVNSISATSNNSSISGDARLNDHRHQSLSLPVRTNSRLVHEYEPHQVETKSFHNKHLTPPKWNKQYLGRGNCASPKQSSKFLGDEVDDKNVHERTLDTMTGHCSSVDVDPPVRDRLFRKDGPLPHPFNPSVNSRDLRSKMLATDDEGEEDEYATKFQDRYGTIARSVGPLSEIETKVGGLRVPKKKPSSGMRHRSKSMSEEVKMLLRSKSKDSASHPSGILLPSISQGEVRRFSRSSRGSAGIHKAGVPGVTIVDTTNNLGRATSHVSSKSSHPPSSDTDSDVDSHGSRDSQETEEDVCFPMVPKHVRIRGIDFDEIEEFITEQRLENEEISKRENELKLRGESSVTTSSEKFSTAALKYTPRFRKTKKSGVLKNKVSENEEKMGTSSSSTMEFEKEMDTEDNKLGMEIKVANTQNTLNSSTERASFDSSINTDTDNDIVPDRFSFFNSNREETIHAADIASIVKKGTPVRSLFEPEDSVWWLDCICPTDEEMKMLAKAFGIHPLTAEDIRMQEAREKVELFRTYYFVCFHTFDPDSESEDFLEPINVYMVVFQQGILTFHFSPISNPASVRRRVRQLRDYVDVSADWLCYAMIDDITDGFAPVIHSIEYEADAIEDSVFLFKEKDFREMLFRIGESRRKVMTLMRLLQGKADVIKMFAKRCHEDSSPLAGHSAQPRADIALYLGDIQDHIITMFQSLLSYEKIFSRSHSNYLAQLQVESFYSNNQVTDMLSKVTMIGTILVPMNLVTGLFGMNVHVPGQDETTYAWFGGILGFIIVAIIVSGFAANWYMDMAQRRDTRKSAINSGVSVKTFGFGRKRKQEQRDRTNRSMVSLPSRYTRYGDLA